MLYIVTKAYKRAIFVKTMFFNKYLPQLFLKLREEVFMIKIAAKIFGFVAFSAFSPTWILMKEALKGVFDLEKALTSPQQLLMEYDHFNQFVSANPDMVTYVLIPQMVMILIISLVFIWAGHFLFEKLCEPLAQQIHAKLLS